MDSYRPPSKGPMLSRPMFVVLFLGLFGLFLFFAHLSKSPEGENAVDMVIPRGLNLAGVSKLLADNHIISSPGWFRRVMQVTGGSKRVRAGEFRFASNGSWLDALLVLYYQEPIVHPVTVPEGFNLRQIAAAVANAGLGRADKFLSLSLSREAARKFGFKSPTLEGFLFPDTYAFSKVDGEERIIEKMVQRFQSKVDNELRNRIRASGMSLEEVVTFASIVEKETGVPKERPIISSVFHNRLKKGMRLQSDPTTIYGIADFDGNLKKRHLSEKTPYNTYTIKGLPPGPIASPGLDAIKAVIEPANTPFLYFVSNNHGEHVFSETYEKHARLVDQLQKRRPNRASASEH